MHQENAVDSLKIYSGEAAGRKSWSPISIHDLVTHEIGKSNMFTASTNQEGIVKYFRWQISLPTMGVGKLCI